MTVTPAAAPTTAPTDHPSKPTLTLPPELAEEYQRAIQALVTEDDEPVDNLFSEKQQHLLVESLYASWSHPRYGKRFLAAANVGVFYSPYESAIVPDVLLSVGVKIYPRVWEQEGKSYLNWIYGKPPDVVIEIVSNRKGGELEHKAELYSWMRVPYYVVYDPKRELGGEVLRAFESTFQGWRPLADTWLPGVELKVVLWRGVYEDLEAEWLRWQDSEGVLVPTGRERAEAERQRAEAAERQVVTIQQQLEVERQRNEQLKARLRALGVELD
ncbi:MAG: Uma2 family endonuclease [Thermoflexales bacterium]|nr:Uma2 family endonuclease [Thermoflexales bacterium]